MEKIVGRVILAIVLMANIVHAGVSLRITDERGTPLKQIVVGEQCTLQIIASQPMRDFQINGIEAFSIIGKNTITQSINGNTTYKYMFFARANEVGNYTIGPVTADINGGTESSESVQLQVTVEPVPTKNIKQAFLRLTIDKKKAVVGEQITGSVRFYCCDDELSLDQIAKSELAEFIVDGFTDPSYGREDIDEVPYTYVEVTWSMAPKKAGLIAIPAWSAHYSSPLAETGFGPFRFMQGLQRQQKRVYSNAVQLEVAPLPPYHGAVHGVGCFEDVAIHANNQVTKEGEANVIRFDIIGQGTLDGYEPIQLTAIPEGLKSYESKKYVQERSDGALQTSYEFIVQGLKVGNWEIPAQRFTYFDVTTKQYVTHATKPLLISVLEQPGLKSSLSTHVASEATIPEEQKIIPVDLTDSEKLPLSTSGIWYLNMYREIPWRWFLGLLLLPLSFIVIIVVRRSYNAYRLNREPLSRKKYAHARAYKAVTDVAKRNAYHELYPVFVELFVSRSDSSIPECSDDAIIIVLRKHGMSQDEIAAWQRFFTDIMRLAYAGSGHYNKTTSDIIKRAYAWLDRLKEVV